MDNERQGRIKRMPTAPNTETSAINPKLTYIQGGPKNYSVRGQWSNVVEAAGAINNKAAWNTRDVLWPSLSSFTFHYDKSARWNARIYRAPRS